MKLVASILLLAQSALAAGPARTEVGTPPPHEDSEDGPKRPEAKDAPADDIREWAPDGATQVVIELTGAEGSVVRTITMYGDQSTSPEEVMELKRALERTGLFALVGADAGAQATLELHRSSATQMVASLVARDGVPIWSAAVDWPQETPKPPENDDEEHYGRVTRYGRERLIVRPGLPGSPAPSTIYFGGYSQPYGFADPSWGWGNGMMGGTPLSKHTDWVVVRGAADVVDELELARVVNNENLENRIREARNKPKLYWGIGFGAGAIAGLTSGFLLYGDKHSDDTRAVGFSLLGVGVASAIMLLLTPSIGNGNKLSEQETEDLVADYNRGLRAKLQLSPSEVRQYEIPPQ